MDLRQLEHFVAVAETLNFRAAAERLHMTQPPLSVSIRKLEKEIGTPLFIRTTHSVRISRAGEAALVDARAALFHAREAMHAAQSAASGFSGSLRVGFVGSAQYSLLPELLPRFRQAYPDVVLRLTEANNTWLLDAVERDVIDSALVRIPLDHRREIRLVPLEQDTFAVAMPRDHPLIRKAAVSLKDLTALPFIAYTASTVPGLHFLVNLMFHEAGVAPTVVQETTQVQTVLFLVESRLGVALVPSRAALRKRDGVVFRPLHHKPARAIGIGLAYKPEFETATAGRFRDIAEGMVAVSPAAMRTP